VQPAKVHGYITLLLDVVKFLTYTFYNRNGISIWSCSRDVISRWVLRLSNTIQKKHFGRLRTAGHHSPRTT
jgi:hypothetical protein